VKTFRDLGYVEGKTIQLEHRFPAERPERFRAGKLTESKVDIIRGRRDRPDGFTVDQHRVNGIGMKVVAALAKQLAGRLSTHTNPAGRGACISVLFPCVVAD
jgi:hypothetical protein